MSLVGRAELVDDVVDVECSGALADGPCGGCLRSGFAMSGREQYFPCAGRDRPHRQGPEETVHPLESKRVVPYFWRNGGGYAPRGQGWTACLHPAEVRGNLRFALSLSSLVGAASV